MKRAIMIVAAGMMAGMALDADAGYVTVTCDEPKVKVVPDGNDFKLFAPGLPENFTTKVTVTPHPDWILVKPSSSFLMGSGEIYETEYEVRHATEPNSKGKISLFHYYIKSNINNEKNIDVPTEVEVTYTAYKNGSECFSNWTVTGNGVEGKSDGSKKAITINFSESYWGILSPTCQWFIGDMQTPKVGAYTIDAVDADEPVAYPDELTDKAKMVVFGADFTSGSPYGFDNYTHWTIPGAKMYAFDRTGYEVAKTNDYYGAQTGRCMYPYASVQENELGDSYLTISKSGLNKPLDKLFDIDSTTLNWHFPAQTEESTVIDFEASPGRSEGKLTAKYGTLVAELPILTFPLQTRSVLVISVNGAQSDAINLETASEIFMQAVTVFEELAFPGMPFDYPDAPPIWGHHDNGSDWLDVQNAIIADDDQGVGQELKDNNYDHIVLILPGTDETQAYGRGDANGKFVYLYSSTINQRTLPHEFGHNLLGESHEDPDLYNLMNVGSARRNLLRYGQWKKINRPNL
ncbi:MAG: hypothetical protein FWH27_19495 [Planctomycetaceae bacterium]|nr:hypothetical protein [Planctomycetaceae bacterium]